MERFAEILGCQIYEYDFNVFKFACPISVTLFCDEEYLFVLEQFIDHKHHNYHADLRTLLIKDLKPDLQSELPLIMEIHKNNKVTQVYIPTIATLIISRDPMYIEVPMSDDIWERFYKLAVGTTRCKSARAF
jgi:hypothetical protein